MRTIFGYHYAGEHEQFTIHGSEANKASLNLRGTPVDISRYVHSTKIAARHIDAWSLDRAMATHRQREVNYCCHDDECSVQGWMNSRLGSMRLSQCFDELSNTCSILQRYIVVVSHFINNTQQCTGFTSSHISSIKLHVNIQNVRRHDDIDSGSSSLGMSIAVWNTSSSSSVY